MNESTFTPGPWDFACDSYGKVRHSRKACVFTTVKTPTGDQLTHIASRIPVWEDARLIAAAPDLLYALQLLMCWKMRDGSPCCCPAGEDEDDFDQPKEMPTVHASGCSDARAAIAKAKGGVLAAAIEKAPKAKCPYCPREQYHNGFIAFCEGAHVYQLAKSDPRYSEV